jgi:hypothetical protein
MPSARYRPSMPRARPPPGHAQHPAVALALLVDEPELLSLPAESIEEDATVATERARGGHAGGDVEERRAVGRENTAMRPSHTGDGETN